MTQLKTPGSSLPRAVVLSRLSKLPDASPVVDALKSDASASRVPRETLESLLEAHRPTMGSDAVRALEQLVSHGAKRSNTVFDVVDTARFEALAAPGKVRKSKEAARRLVAFSSAAAPRRAVGEKAKIAGGTWEAKTTGNTGPASGAPLLVPEQPHAIAWAVGELLRLPRDTGIPQTLRDFGPTSFLTMPALNRAGNRLFLGVLPDNQPTTVHALDAQTGETLWSHEVTEGTKGGTPLPMVLSHDEKRLFHVKWDEGVRAYDAETGAPLWKAPLPYTRSHPLESPDGSAVFVLADDHLVACDAETGETRWKTDAKVRSGGRCEVTLDGQLLLVPATDGLRAFEISSGSLLWHMTDGLPPGVGVSIAKDGTAWVAGKDSVLLGVDSDTGRIEKTWNLEVDGRGQIPVVAPTLLRDDSELALRTQSGLLRVRLSDGACASTEVSSMDFGPNFTMSPDGQFALAFGTRRNIPSVRLPDFEGPA